jgi:hypothetical protein
MRERFEPMSKSFKPSVWKRPPLEQRTPRLMPAVCHLISQLHQLSPGCEQGYRFSGQCKFYHILGFILFCSHFIATSMLIF